MHILESKKKKKHFHLFLFGLHKLKRVWILSLFQWAEVKKELEMIFYVTDAVFLFIFFSLSCWLVHLVISQLLLV